MPCWALGIFNISMLILYGEGSRAFLRLQEEIMRKNPDKSLLAWGPLSGSHLPVPASDVANPLCAYRPRLTFSVMKECVDYICALTSHTQHGSHLWFPDSLLAHSPKDFVCSSSVRCISHPEYMRRLQMIIPSAMLDLVVTPYGVRTFSPSFPSHSATPSYLPDISLLSTVAKIHPTVTRGILRSYHVNSWTRLTQGQMNFSLLYAVDVPQPRT